MRIAYLLLSPTFGIHQYAADLANRAARQHEIHLVTTTNAPRDRYDPSLQIHTPLTTTNSGLSPESLRLRSLGRVLSALRELRPDLVHFPGPHLWNILLVHWLRRRGTPVIHTIHDLKPHDERPPRNLLRLWNSMVIRAADHILVHGRQFREHLVKKRKGPERVSYLPLLHLFLGYQMTAQLDVNDVDVVYEPFVLFFGRLEEYKGVEALLTAWHQLRFSRPAEPNREQFSLVVAGEGRLPNRFSKRLPPGIEIRLRRIEDAEAIDLFRRCSLVVLPYTSSTQSALVAAAYRFSKPVLITRTGALPEYVVEGETGSIVEPDNPQALASALDLAMADPGRLRAMGQAGRAWYEKHRREEAADLMSLYDRYAEREKAPAMADGF